MLPFYLLTRRLAIDLQRKHENRLFFLLNIIDFRALFAWVLKKNRTK
jgi:hypothetical protein